MGRCCLVVDTQGRLKSNNNSESEQNLPRDTTEITAIQTLFITNPLLWTNFQMMRREETRDRVGGKSRRRRRKKRGKCQINSGPAKLHHESLPWADSSPNCWMVPAGETSDRLHYCLNFHSNSHESQPRPSVSLRIISTSPLWISSSAGHVSNNKPQCSFFHFFFQFHPSGCIHLQKQGPGLVAKHHYTMHATV